MNPKIKTLIIDTIRFDLWQKLIKDEQGIYGRSIDIVDYGILVDEKLIIDLLSLKNEEAFHRPDLLIYFRGEGFSIYIENSNPADFEALEDPNATHIVINLDRGLFCINKRDTETEKYFLTELTKVFLPTN